MCGIAGCNGEHPDTIRQMTEALAHRGPDGAGTFTGHGVSLGHARLAILDPRPEGNQPMWNEDRTVAIVYNGEIFNFRELKERFALRCITGTDTEVLLKLYEAEGTRFVSHLIGMFAFALFDTRTKTWMLARDTSGIKPLFVSYPKGELHFASEMRSLLSALPTKPALNLRSLSHYLRLQYVPGPETLCEGIESLPPGTLLTWKAGREERLTFTAPGGSPAIPTRTVFRETFPDLMDQCVRDHLVSDKPVGIFLSGGMDSSIVLHHMRHYAATPIKTFTVRFEATKEEGAKRFNTDADLAAQTAKHYGTDHTEILLTADTYRTLYRDTARSLDQPNADSVSVAQFLLAHEAKKHVDVVLSGAGGDELFGGYPRYRIARILSSLRLIPPHARSLVGSAFGYPGDVLCMHPGSLLAERLLARPGKEIEQIVQGDWFDRAATATLFAERFARLPGKDPVRTFMEFDRHLWLVDESLRLADALIGATAIEHGQALLTANTKHYGVIKEMALEQFRPE